MTGPGRRSSSPRASAVRTSSPSWVGTRRSAPALRTSTSTRTAFASACASCNGAYCGSCAASLRGPATAASVCTRRRARRTVPRSPRSRAHVPRLRACVWIHHDVRVARRRTGGTCTAGCAVDSRLRRKDPGRTATMRFPASGGSNCSCFQSACYFTCASDLDCAAGKACGIRPRRTCARRSRARRTPTAQSPERAGQVRGRRVHDRPHQGHRLQSLDVRLLCRSLHGVRCTSDSNCTTGSAHSFCVKAPAAATTFSSAVTN